MTMHDFFLSFFLNAVTDIKETATAVNFTMLKLVALQADDINLSGRSDVGNYSLMYIYYKKGSHLKLFIIYRMITNFLRSNEV